MRSNDEEYYKEILSLVTESIDESVKMQEEFFNEERILDNAVDRYDYVNEANPLLATSYTFFIEKISDFFSGKKKIFLFSSDKSFHNYWSGHDFLDTIILDIDKTNNLIDCIKDKAGLSGLSGQFDFIYVEVYLEGDLLVSALEYLSESGLGLFTVEDSYTAKFIELMSEKGFYIDGVFEFPSIYEEAGKLNILAIKKIESRDVFLAEVSNYKSHYNIVCNYFEEKNKNDLAYGLIVQSSSFFSMDWTRLGLQLNAIQDKNSNLVLFSLKDVCLSFDGFESQKDEVKMNSIYMPIKKSHEPACSISASPIPHSLGLYQIELTDNVLPEYLELYFKKGVGAATINQFYSLYEPSVSRLKVLDIKFLLPSLDAQRSIVKATKSLELLAQQIASINNHLVDNNVDIELIEQKIEKASTYFYYTNSNLVLKNIINNGESVNVEFKQTYYWCIREKERKKYISDGALKNIVAFINTKGGRLLIGVDDSGSIIGVDTELGQLNYNKDQYLKGINNNIKDRIGAEFFPYIDYEFIELENKTLLVFNCTQSDIPCFFDKDFYIRTSPSAQKLESKQVIIYIDDRRKRRLRRESDNN